MEKTIEEKASAAGLTSCWSCKGPVLRLVPFCHTCGIIQPSSDASHFERLGVPVGFDIDLDVLERRHIGLQLRLHPDRFVGKSARERLMAEEQAANLNKAYEILKDPLTRADYLLSLQNHSVALDREQTIEDVELLTKILERREKLAEANTSLAVETLAAEAGAQALDLVARLSSAFHREDFDEASNLAIELKYCRKFLQEARLRLFALEEA